MKKAFLDDRTKEDVIAQIGRLAESYTPEWKFDPAHPDMGMALAQIFADMFCGTLKRYNRIPEKLHRSFFAQIGEKLLNAVPAEGYVTFKLSSHEFGGAALPKGTNVMGPGKEGKHEEIVYETVEDLYVTPAELTHLIYTDGQEDYIEKKDWKKPFRPFSPENENLQEHVLYLCQNEVLSVTGEAEIRLKLKPYREKTREAGENWLLDEEEISIAYGAGEGFVEFKNRSMEGDGLVLRRDASLPKAAEMEFFGKKGYWIRCRCLKPWKREPFLVEDIRLAAKREEMEPDLIQTELGQQRNEGFFPFGECPALFGECYFASKEALGKAGARVRMTFGLDYEKVPLDNSVKVERNWKLLMKRSDFVPDPVYDITVEQVVWEYYNGSGWSRLPLGSACENLFNGKSGRAGERLELEFVCPADAALLEWQCAPTRYIRVRVIRMNNLFQVKGTYITPVISDVRFHYSYMEEGRPPEFAAAFNQREQRIFCVKELKRGNVCWEIFSGQRRKAPSLYLGFDRPLTGGPIRSFCRVEESNQGEQSRLVFEYGGRKGFAPLTVLDGTGNLKESGSFTFVGKEDFTLSTVCGETAYWIRITDERDVSQKESAVKQGPKIEGIFFNAVRIQAVEDRAPEYFTIRTGEKNKVCRLLRGNIYDLAVWVNEISTISPAEREKMREQGRLWETADALGQLTGIWVKWEETGDFARSAAEDRHYLLDRNEGTVTFSDGTRGAIPAFGEEETIRVHYRCGGGVRGNQPPGAIERIGGSFGFVNAVTNPIPICGGCDQETVSQALRRGAQALRHGGRAVTAGDYEALAREASRYVQKVKCYPGYDRQGTYEPGCITLVVLSREFKNGSMYFQKMREEILSYLSCRMGGNQAELGHLYVTEPQFVEVNCYVRVAAVDAECVFEVKKCVEERLEQFIHPVTGNYHGKGWDIGTVPNETQIANALKGIPGIRFVRELRTISLRSDIRFAVALSGKHTIVVETEE